MVRFDPSVGAFSNIDQLRDESFNSITGLNGSGKSNILDAICFVLGITNMSTVRAQNLQVCQFSLFAAQPIE
jgi:AAA15 family ATPase/GTPase